MRAILSILVMPLSIFWISVFFGIFFIVLKKLNLGKWILCFSGVWILIITTPLVPNYLVSNLENKYAVLIEPEKVIKDTMVNIIVLGGGHTNDSSLSFNDQLTQSALGRLCEGIRIQRMLPLSKLILSGAGKDKCLSQATILKNTACILGVNPNNIILQENPRNTKEEAESYLKIFGKQGILIIVTSAIHMPRAIKLFVEAGLDPIAAPTNHLIKHDVEDKVNFMPSSENILKMEQAMHEYIGLFVSNFE